MITELSGNEFYCLEKRGFECSHIVIGNSVHSLGIQGKIASEMRGMLGLELKDLSQTLNQGRINAFQRMQDKKNEHVIIGIKNNLILHAGYLEFLSTGSALIDKNNSQKNYSTQANGQELYAWLDASYEPIQFVFGNVAYSTGSSGGLIGGLKALGQGERKNLSEIFNKSRHLALERLLTIAREAKANSVIGIKIQTNAYSGANEMVLSGTAAYYSPASTFNEVQTSHLTALETWNLASLGYVPVRLFLASSVYALGFWGRMRTSFSSLASESTELSEMIKEARLNTLAKINEQAVEAGVEKVIGLKTLVYPLANGLFEFFSYGTAIKKMADITTESAQLPLQVFLWQ